MHVTTRVVACTPRRLPEDIDKERARVALGERLAICRRRTGLDQAELAAAVGVSRITISNWERGIREPAATDLPPLCAAFRTRGLLVSPSQLLGTDPMPETS